MAEQRMSFSDLVGLKIDEVSVPASDCIRIRLSNGKRIYVDKDAIFDQAGNTLEAK